MIGVISYLTNYPNCPQFCHDLADLQYSFVLKIFLDCYIVLSDFVDFIKFFRSLLFKF